MYTIKHFSDEETMTQKVSYSKFGPHKKEHDQLIKKGKDFKDDYDSGKMMISIEVRDFLKDWIVNHIQNVDNLYNDAIKKNGEKKRTICE